MEAGHSVFSLAENRKSSRRDSEDNPENGMKMGKSRRDHTDNSRRMCDQRELRCWALLQEPSLGPGRAPRHQWHSVIKSALANPDDPARTWPLSRPGSSEQGMEVVVT
jgi:hypothetical protein